MSNTNFFQTAAFIWSIADLLRGDFKLPQYGRVILPFTLLRRLECILAPTKEAVVAEADKLKASPLPEEGREKFLLRATNGLSFFNTSPMDLSKMGQKDIKENLENYVQCFSKDAREIFEYLKFSELVGLLDDANLLFKIVKKFATTDLSPKAISNHEMGLVFEELIRRFAESSNETAGEHFTPRDIVRLTTSLVFKEDDEVLSKNGIIRTIYDPTVGTGGFLSSGMEYVHELNPNAVIRAFGQELNPESYAICKADMLIKGMDMSRIKLGDTLSNDQLPQDRFDYMLSNPPFGMDWKKIEGEINDEHQQKGFNGRFGPGLPRVSDGSLLFLLHLISKMRDSDIVDSSVSNGGRIGIILNGSPLFTGGAGSGESEIRRYILEADLLEGIVALPTDMFYNTGIATYVWILSNKKVTERQGKVQLIDGTNLCGKMRKSLGSKRNLMSEDDIKLITRIFGEFEVVDATSLKELGLEKAPEKKSNRDRQPITVKTEAPKTFASKILSNTDFGYRRLTIERPLRLSAQVTDEAITTLRFATKPLNAPMKRLYDEFAAQWQDDSYGNFADIEVEARAIIKSDFTDLKEKHIKDLLDSRMWLAQRELMHKAQQIQLALGAKAGGKELVSNDFNEFQLILNDAIGTLGVKLNAREKKQFISAITSKNHAAEPVVKEELKEIAQPLYGAFEYRGCVVLFEPDEDLRDSENVPLNSAIATSSLIENYFKSEVLPYSSDAWINASKRDDKDGDVGIVGYRINFKSYFQRDYSRDKLLQGSPIRFKEIVRLSDNGLYVLESFTGKIIEFSSLSEKRKMLNPTRFDFLHETLLPEFYNLFLQQEEGRDWLDSNFMSNSGVSRHIYISAWLNTRFSLPPIANQSKLIDFQSECEAVLTRVNLLKNSVFSNFQSSREQLLPYLSVASRYEQEFSSMLPTPLAILWELAESKFNERERCEAFIKFFEYLGIYLVSFIFGQSKPSKGTFYKRKKELSSITMGFGYNRLSEYKKKIDPSLGIENLVCCDEVINILHEATDLRNDISHRGLPSAAAVTKAKETVQRLNQAMQLEHREFFETTTLIKPIQAKFDGIGFLNEVEVLKGLGLNPSRTAQFKTSEPMISGELYLAHSDLTVNENIAVTKMFPLMVMREILPESDIMAFYFYSDLQEDKLRFVCPYPNVTTYTLLEQNTIIDNLE
ncbi:N-6 DNA methylase [Paramixta manurensis]|uniref:site-specific DNA-methyltransferase (adenine-specific) n=1 Tax=Paramixta manurensis TaxID=2740817 RepID=A0A6M8U7S1_9GAMM|nr:N-6 DNA methylase [Erwiniaceae bacterium PD-1]